jgi:hypothetical protein
METTPIAGIQNLPAASSAPSSPAASTPSALGPVFSGLLASILQSARNQTVREPSGPATRQMEQADLSASSTNVPIALSAAAPSEALGPAGQDAVASGHSVSPALTQPAAHPPSNRTANHANVSATSSLFAASLQTRSGAPLQSLVPSLVSPNHAFTVASPAANSGASSQPPLAATPSTALDPSLNDFAVSPTQSPSGIEASADAAFLHGFFTSSTASSAIAPSPHTVTAPSNPHSSLGPLGDFGTRNQSGTTAGVSTNLFDTPAASAAVDRNSAAIPPNAGLPFEPIPSPTGIFRAASAVVLPAPADDENGKFPAEPSADGETSSNVGPVEPVFLQAPLLQSAAVDASPNPATNFTDTAATIAARPQPHPAPAIATAVAPPKVSLPTPLAENPTPTWLEPFSLRGVGSSGDNLPKAPALTISSATTLPSSEAHRAPLAATLAKANAEQENSSPLQPISSASAAASHAGNDQGSNDSTLEYRSHETADAASNANAPGASLKPSDASFSSAVAAAPANVASVSPANVPTSIAPLVATPAATVLTPAATGTAHEAVASEPPSASLPAPPPHLAGANASISDAQISQGAGRSEMRIAMQSDDLGSLELHARMSGDTLGANITVEKRDAHTILANELPALQQALSDKQLRVEQLSLLHAPLQASAGDTSGQSFGTPGQGAHRHAQSDSPGGAETASSLPSTVFSPEATEVYDAQGRLSVLA